MAKTMKSGKTRRTYPKGKKTQKVKVTKTVAVTPMKDTAKAQVIALMRKMLHQSQENKEIGWQIQTATPHNSAISNADLVPIIQEIPPGDTGYGRLGDRITPRSLVVKGVVSVLDNPDIRPYFVRIIMASQKDVKCGAQVGTSTDPAHLLRPAFDGSAEVPFNGNRAELNYYVNDNKFKVYYDRTFLVTPSTVASGFPQMGSQFVFSKTFKSLPKQLSWDEGNGNWANNFAPFLAIGYAYADGGAPDTVATRISVDAYARLTYEDS